jgi:hypothetical protein
MEQAGTLVAPRTVVGDELIDVDPDTTERARDPSFLERVLSADEQQLVRTSREPVGLVWKLWTAKLAAFKVLMADDWDMPFAPRAFEVSPLEGLVDMRGHTVAVCWRRVGDALGCVGWRGDGEDVTSAIEAIGDNAHGLLTPRERASIGDTAAAEARLLAKRAVVDRLGARWIDVELVRAPRARSTGRAYGPPEVWVRGEVSRAVTVSMSHHGRFVGCAVGARSV